MSAPNNTLGRLYIAHFSDIITIPLVIIMLLKQIYGRCIWIEKKDEGGMLKEPGGKILEKCGWDSPKKLCEGLNLNPVSTSVL